MNSRSILLKQSLVEIYPFSELAWIKLLQLKFTRTEDIASFKFGRLIKLVLMNIGFC